MNYVERISKHRAVLMALAITIVVVYHFKCWVNGFPWYIGMVLQYGYIGVDIFYFLSGFGLTYSFQKNTLGTFYGNRMRRILPSYLLYGTLLVLFLFVCGRSLSMWQIIYKFSLVEYVVEHAGVDWYVSSILILYIIFPLLYHFVKKTKTVLVLLITPIIFVVTLMFNFHWCHSAMLQRLPMFILGIWCAMNSKSTKIKAIFGSYVFYFVCIVGYIYLTYGAKGFKSGTGMEFLLTDLLVPVLLLGVFNKVTYQYVALFFNKLNVVGGVNLIAKNTLQIYYGTNLAMLSYDLFNAPKSIKALIFFLALIFGSHLFVWITNKANAFFS